MADLPVSFDERQVDEIANFLLRVYEIHEVIIAETGGLPGLRDLNLLHSAVARPFATFDGQDLYPAVFDKAAALFHSLIKNHPFMDGTKRTAFAATLYFLNQSGQPLPETFPTNSVVEFCVAVAEENMRLSAGENVQRHSIANIAEWFRKHLEGE
jgi:death-on-curing protein